MPLTYEEFREEAGDEFDYIEEPEIWRDEETGTVEHPRTCCCVECLPTPQETKCEFCLERSLTVEERENGETMCQPCWSTRLEEANCES